jgi:tetratricopeptide (TPR) repeat protein
MEGTQGTSHRIVTHEGEPLTGDAIQEQLPDPATGLILVDNVQGPTKTTLSPLVLLQAYQSVLAGNPKNATDIRSRYDLLLDRLSKSEPNNALILSALARRELEKRSAEGTSAAISYLSKAVKIGSNHYQDYLLLASILFGSDQNQQAVKILKQAVSRFPNIPTPYEALSYCYMSIGDAADAKEILKKGLSIFPSDPHLQEVQHDLEGHP